MEKVLKQLKIEKHNPAYFFGGHKGLFSDAKIESYNPSTGAVLATVSCASKSQYNNLVNKSIESWKSWRMLPAPQRGEVIRCVGNKLREKKDLLGTLVSLEMGKSKVEGDGEVQEMIDIADFAVGLSRQLYGLSMHSERPKHRMMEQWHPLGVVGVITAFNFPVAVWSWNAFIAAICGNVVLWKPSLKTPLCAIAVQHICNEVLNDLGYEGIFNLCIGDQANVSETLVQDSRIALVSATGSTVMGKDVAQQVGARLGKSLLELGGNNAILLDETADLSLAIPGIFFGAIGTAGQRCTSTRRLFIHHTRFDEVCDSLQQAYKQVRVGDPLDKKNHMGPLIDQIAVDNYSKAIKLAKEQGGEILSGGNRIERKGFFVEPTLIKIAKNASIVHEETFAPILYIMSYTELEEAIQMNNEVPQGLSSAIFTNSIKHSEIFLSAKGSDCGIANVNIGTSGAEIGGAFGGEKETGGGREAGSDSWKAYMRRQTVTINWGDTLPLSQGITFQL